MKPSSSILPAACLLVLALCLPAHAEWKWKMPNLLPGGEKKAADPIIETSKALTLPGSQLNPLVPLKKLNDGTKDILLSANAKAQRALRKTTDALTPWKKKPEPVPLKSSITSTRRIVRRQTEPEPKKSIYSGWFGGDPPPEPRRPRNVSDWMANPRPR